MGVAAAPRGPGAKGERYYDWAWIALTPNREDEDDQIGLRLEY